MFAPLLLGFVPLLSRLIKAKFHCLSGKGQTMMISLKFMANVLTYSELKNCFRKSGIYNNPQLLNALDLIQRFLDFKFENVQLLNELDLLSNGRFGLI